MALTIRRGTSSRRMIVAAASGSVGDTTAPRTNAASQERPGTIACAAKATAHIVTSTSPTALRVSPRRLARRSLKFAKIADPYRSGGRKTTSTTSGSSLTSGNPGTKPNRAPPTTSTIGYGTDTLRASALRPATATSRPAIRISAWPIAQVCRFARWAFGLRSFPRGRWTADTRRGRVARSGPGGLAGRLEAARAGPRAVPGSRDGRRLGRGRLDRVRRLPAGSHDRGDRARADPVRGRARERAARDPLRARAGNLAGGGGHRPHCPDRR